VLPAGNALLPLRLVVDSRPSQSAYILADHFARSDPLVERFERWARVVLRMGFRSTMPRQQPDRVREPWPSRRMQAVLGRSPRSYFQELRVERAVYLLKTTARV